MYILFHFSLHENIVLETVTPVLKLTSLAQHFTEVLKERSGADGSLKIHKDSSYTENPMERDDVEESVKVLESGTAKCNVIKENEQ